MYTGFHRITEEGRAVDDTRYHVCHTLSSLMLQRGAGPEVISGALGHSSAAFTTDVYSYPEGKVCVPQEKMC